MLDMQLIDNTIEELENDDTNFNNCQKLSSLYIIKQYYKPGSNRLKTGVEANIKKELSDILPHYEKYLSLKAEYQLNQIGKEPVIIAFDSVCQEIKEFIQILYSSTDTSEERDSLRTCLESIQMLRNP